MKGLMHDRFYTETECPKCEELPCKCSELDQETKELEEAERLREIRGGQ